MNTMLVYWGWFVYIEEMNKKFNNENRVVFKEMFKILEFGGVILLQKLLYYS